MSKELILKMNRAEAVVTVRGLHTLRDMVLYGEIKLSKAKPKTLFELLKTKIENLNKELKNHKEV